MNWNKIDVLESHKEDICAYGAVSTAEFPLFNTLLTFQLSYQIQPFSVLTKSYLKGKMQASRKSVLSYPAILS